MSFTEKISKPAGRGLSITPRCIVTALLLSALASVPAWSPARALGPEPYPEGPVSFETYEPERGVVRPGEMTEYEFSWNGIKAARAVMAVSESAAPRHTRPIGFYQRDPSQLRKI